MFFAKTLAATGLMTLANAHMLMKSPVPFESQNGNNGPLDPSGSNFPCKSTGPATYANGEVNKYPQGSKQTLSTIGQAVHGGGSCQISITYDEAPDKNSVWKVIHSIEGGCPARNTPGNAGGDASAVAPDTYDFTVPEDLPTGKGVVAWTWINRVGNREFYMNWYVSYFSSSTVVLTYSSARSSPSRAEVPASARTRTCSSLSSLPSTPAPSPRWQTTRPPAGCPRWPGTRRSSR